MLRRRLMANKGLEGFVDLGLPSGTLWANGNIVKNGSTYAIGEETDYGTYFSWGNIEGHNEGEGYNFNETTYNSTAGKSLKAEDIASNDATHDAALARLGSPWHLPTKENIQELCDYTDKEWVGDYNGTGVRGRKFMKKTDHSVYIFFPFNGYYVNTTLYSRSYGGYYWSSSYYDKDAAYSFQFSTGNPVPAKISRIVGLSVRPVISGDGTYRFTFSSYKIYVHNGNNSRPHTSFTPNTDIWVVLHNTDYDNTSYMVIGEFKAGISYPIVSQYNTYYYYLVDDTNKEIIISDIDLATYDSDINISIVFPNGYEGQEVIGNFDDGTEAVTDNGSLYEFEDLKINGKNTIVGNANYNYYLYDQVEMGL